MNSDDDIYDYCIKLLIIGEPNVGKTSLLYRIINDKFLLDYNSTIGVDFGYTIYKTNKSYKFQIWDAAGQEKFTPITSSFFGNIAVYLIMFDKSNYDSFRKLNNWIEKVNTLSKSKHIKIIIGNKNDLKNQEVLDSEIDKFVKKNRYLYTEISVKTGNNISNIFPLIINILNEKIIKGEIIPNVDKSLTTSNYKRLEIDDNIERPKYKCCIIQ